MSAEHRAETATILVVEDNPVSMAVMRGTLEKEGFDVRTARTGGEALEQMHQPLPDLVLQDIMLPDIDGFDLVRLLRQAEGAASVPILAVTGLLGGSAREGAFADFADVLFKPVTPSDLTAVVRAHLPPARSAPASESARRILLVDDDPIQAKLQRVQLELAGYSVTTAEDGQAALEIALRDPPDAIVSDVLMPRLDGFRLCASLRERQELAGIPIILASSSYVEQDDRELAARVGADAFVARTPDLAEVLEALRRSFVDPRPRAPSAGPVGLDEYTTRVVRQLERQVAARATLARRLSLHQAELGIIAELGKLVGHGPRIEDVLRGILERSLDAWAVSRGAAFVRDPEGRLRLQFQQGFAADSAVGDFFGHPELLQHLVERRDPIVLPSDGDWEDAQRDVLARCAARALLVSPLVAEGEPLGALVMALDSRDPEIGSDWAPFARAIGAQVAEAVALSQAFGRVSAAEERYRKMFEHALVGMYETDRDGRLRLANPALARILGYASPDELLASVADLGEMCIEPARRAELRRLLEQHGSLERFESRLRRPLGEAVWTSESVNALRDEQGRIVGYEGMLWDITDRKQAESERLQAEKRLATQYAVTRVLAQAEGLHAATPRILHAISQVADWDVGDLWLIEPEAGVLRCEGVWSAEPMPEFERDTRDRRFASGQGLPGQVWAAGSALWIEDLQAHENFLRQESAAHHGLRTGFAFPVRHRERVTGVIEFFSRGSEAPDVEVERMLEALGRQIGEFVERRRAEQALQETQRRLEQVMASSLAVIYLLEERPEAPPVALWVSPNIERLFGHTSRAALDPAWWVENVHPEDLETALFSLGELAIRGKRTCEYRIRHGDGSYRWVRDDNAHMPGPEQGPRQIVGSWVDVTREKEADEEVLRKRETLAQTEKLAAMGSLLAGVAHELNNPLSVVLGQAALLTRAVEGTPLAERAHKIVAAAERCGRIVGNFLALARQRPPERRSVRLNDLVQGVVEMLGYQLRVDSLEVTMELARELPGLWADPHQLQQVMINLVTNAQHAMRGTPEPRRLRITTRHDGESVVLELADSGPGIPADVRTRLFEPFFTTKPPGEGTGLGLSLCRGIVAEHGGTIGFECPPEGGTLFRVALPLAQPREPAASGSPASPIAPQPRQRRILVVDDEVEVAEVAADFLRELGHEADVAPSGAVALAELARQRYELVLSDMKMPHMDGPAFFREATRLFPYLAGRFVFLTGDNLSQDVASFLERSGAPGIAKPFQMEDLADVVAKLLID